MRPPCAPDTGTALNRRCITGTALNRRRRPAPLQCSEDFDFDGMLKYCVELSGKLKLEPLLRDAELLASYSGEAGREIIAGLAGGRGGPVTRPAAPCISSFVSWFFQF